METTRFRNFGLELKYFPKFNATGRFLLISFNSAVEEQNPGTYLKECITTLTDYVLHCVPDSDFVRLRIHNIESAEVKWLALYCVAGGLGRSRESDSEQS